MVGEFAWKMPNRIPEMLAEMTWSLWSGIDRMAKGSIDHHGDSPNVVGYLSTCIRGRIQRFINDERRYRHRFNSLRSAKIKRIRPKPEGLLLILEGCIKKPVERKVIEGRINGLTDEQIASLVNLTRERVRQIRREIETRFLEKLDVY